jgi:hypothetical protein
MHMGLRTWLGRLFWREPKNPEPLTRYVRAASREYRELAGTTNPDRSEALIRSIRENQERIERLAKD